MARKSTIAVENINVRELAREVRNFARENGYEVGSRGRVSAELFVEYLMTKPQLARELAKALNIPVGVRGRVAYETTAAVGVALAANKATRVA